MRALVLSGGGAKGAYQVGVLQKWMLDDHLDYDILCGISVGALNTSVLAQSKMNNPSEAFMRLAGVWDRVTNKKVRKDWFFWGKLAALWKKSVYDSRPLQKWVRSELDPELIKESGRRLRVGAVSWESGTAFYATEDTAALRDWVYSSACFPVAFEPLKIGAEHWTDGGVYDVAPLGEAIRLGAKEIDVVLTSNPEHPEPWPCKGKKAISYALRAIDLMSFEILRNDVRICFLKNELAQQGAPYQKVKIRLVYPEHTLTDDSLDFTPSKLAEMRRKGYQDACKAPSE